MKFHELAAVYETIQKATGRLEITQQLANLLRAASPEEAGYIAYISLGELYPPYRGVVFSIAEQSSYKIAAHILSLSMEEVKKLAHTSGDVGAVIAQATWQTHQELTVSEVYQELCEIAEIGGEGSQDERLRRVESLLRRLDPLSAGFVMRILVGKLRLGFSDMTLIDALSWMLTGNKSVRSIIEHAYNVSADIGRIATLARSGGIPALQTIQIIPGIPIRPAAAERLPDPAAVIDKLGTCVVQPKLDGFRVQVHIWHEKTTQQVQFFSRNLQSMNGMFPELEEAIRACTVQSAIIEGEALAYDEETGNYLHFQQTVKRRRKHDVAETAAEYPLRLVLFDILYYNGGSLLNKTHAERYALLHSLFDPCSQKAHNALVVIEEYKMTTKEQLEDYFATVVSQGLEGIIAKRDDASYQPGKRNFNWIKLKRQTIGSKLGDTIDAIVLGYYYGKGKRSQFGIGSCLLGVYDENNGNFVTIAKVGTGFTDAEWKQLKKWCDEHAMDHKPVNVVCDERLYADVWVEPKLILEIAADEITRSPIHTAAQDSKKQGLALRFPRVIGFREDKSALEVTTVAEVLEFVKYLQ